MAYKELEIQQALATADSKLSLAAYSSYLQKLYGLHAYGRSAAVKCLLLFRFALGTWDYRQGAVNAFDEDGLTSIIRRMNQL